MSEQEKKRRPGAAKKSQPQRNPYAPLICLLESVLLTYLAVCLLWHSLTTLSPFMFAIEKTPLVNTGTVLQRIGLVIAAAAAVLIPQRKKGPGRFLLYGVCGSAAVSSFLMRRYGYQANLNTILWMLIVFALYYSAPFQIREKRLSRFVTGMYILLACLWFFACCLSLIQFALQIGSGGPNHAPNILLRGTGFSENRLTGVFGYPEYGAITGLLLMIAGCYYFVTARRLLPRIVLVILNIPLFIYLVLSGSRNAAVALYLTCFLGAFLFFLKSFRRTAGRGGVVCLALSLAVLAGIHILYTGVRAGAVHVPGMFSETAEEENEEKEEKPSGNAGPVFSGQDLVCSAQVTTRFLASLYESKAENAVLQKEQNEQDDESEGGLLDRKYNGGDITTGRLRIWKEYLSLAWDIGLFGLSPENSGFYIKEHHPEMYIAAVIRKFYPELYETGYVFHPHSGYLKAFVSSGFLGMLLLTGFLGACLYRAVSYIRKCRVISPAFLFSFLIIIACASSAVFDLELFFVFNPATFIFWFCHVLMIRASRMKRTAG